MITLIKKPIRLIVFLSTLYFLLSTFAWADSISSTELITDAKQYDGKEVFFEGEVIGDVMVRGNYAWINVNDGKNAIGIWVDKNLTKEISYTGGYSLKGDWIGINGYFARACLEHGGDLDIHAKALKIIKKGMPLEEKISQFKIKLVIAFFVICLIIAVIYFLKLNYGKKS